MMMKKLVSLAQAIFDETRLQIIKLLQTREMCVCELAAVLNLSSPRISQHLGVLRRGKIVKERREGKWIYYSLIPKTLEEFNRDWNSLLKASNDDLTEMKAVLKRLQKADLVKIKEQCAATGTRPPKSKPNQKEGEENGD